MTRGRRFGVLGALYFSQGLPFGFFTLALPIVLRARGVSLEAVGASGLLLLPWALKFVWGPAIDRYGTRRGWLLPLQLATITLLAGLACVDPARDLEVLGVGMVLASLLASTQDVATDGLAVSLLPEEDRGLGNGLQVGAYRLGMIVGGGGVLVLYDQLGAPVAFGVMAGLLALATWPVWTLVEPERVAVERVGWRSMVAAIPSIGAGWWAVLATYKAGESAASAMVKALLVDAGWSPTDLGWALGLGGSAAGLGGAALGGWVAGRVDRTRALVGFGAVQAVAIALLVVPATFGASRAGAVGVVAVEHWTSGMATAALFAAMMDRCRPGHEATDYTLQACAVVFATGAAGATSGLVAGAFGYGGHFVVATGLAVLGVGVAAFGRGR